MASGVGRGEGPLALMAPKGVLFPTGSWIIAHCLLCAGGVNSALSHGRDQCSAARGEAETRLQSVVGSARVASGQLARSLYGAAVPGPTDACRGADVRRSPTSPRA